MAHRTSDWFFCSECGAKVAWAVSKAGKKYLAVEAVWQGHTKSKVILRFHECSPDEDYKAQQAAVVAKAQASGTVIKGVTVEVFKGRKVPIGTIGKVFWVATKTDGYGTIKVGLIDSDGTKHYTAIDNVRTH